ncbi:MAG: GNAT family N-acetyltransferase [Erysipelotrichaceae bacterium]|nr:GNAT family N-acetyltransferase [Erysipelotrichaceae bacterium]
MSIQIIPYEKKYLDDIRYINVAVSTHPDKPLEEKILCQHLYIDYYAFNCPENCFVALDADKDLIAGYIICETDYRRFKKHLLEEYMTEAIALHPDFEQIIRDEIVPYEKWNDEYDAHMHMDVRPGYQHTGLGTMLIQRLFRHLREKDCKGVMLLVSKKNEGANRFYQKNGMDIIDVTECNVRGKKL